MLYYSIPFFISFAFENEQGETFLSLKPNKHAEYTLAKNCCAHFSRDYTLSLRFDKQD